MSAPPGMGSTRSLSSTVSKQDLMRRPMWRGLPLRDYLDSVPKGTKAVYTDEPATDTMATEGEDFPSGTEVTFVGKAVAGVRNGGSYFVNRTGENEFTLCRDEELTQQVTGIAIKEGYFTGGASKVLRVRVCSSQMQHKDWQIVTASPDMTVEEFKQTIAMARAREIGKIQKDCHVGEFHPARMKLFYTPGGLSIEGEVGRRECFFSRLEGWRILADAKKLHQYGIQDNDLVVATSKRVMQ